ncbi:MBL fold metallo-hydrolase [Mollicutes bacterium LVI A0078]|nr:MBL fold metallo-hydrolase [Mollicutes bacterium LVI A0075]WOO90080.1 MBL fold metallo-hydrolase [Mollicutes bacterium LVI A0078]
MNIKWLGHSCFLITAADGTTVLHDPYKDMLGYKLPKGLKVDYVLSSHAHSDHNYTEGLEPGFKLIDQYGVTTEVIEFTGTLSYHDQVQGEERGDNAIFSYVLDGLKIAHLGDLGHVLDEKQVAALAGTDILLIAVGGGYTINGELAAEVANQVNPKIVIPMHYRTRALGPFGLKFEKVTKFTDAYNKTVNKVKTITISEQSIDKQADVIIMDYKQK